MTGPEDQAAAGRDRLRAGHADREQAIETLKDAFVQGRLTRDELDARADRVLAARTRADLAALTADVPAAAGTARPPAPVRRRRPLVRAAAGSGGCAVVAFAALRIFDVIETEPVTAPGPAPHHSLALALLVVAVAAVVAALLIMGYGVGASIEMRRSRRQLPPRPGPGGRAVEGGQRGRAAHGLVPPGPGDGQALSTELRDRQSRQRRRHARAGAGRGTVWRQAGTWPSPAHSGCTEIRREIISDGHGSGRAGIWSRGVQFLECGTETGRSLTRWPLARTRPPRTGATSGST
jgi:DUF1707 SHOCT-like domain